MKELECIGLPSGDPQSLPSVTTGGSQDWLPQCSKSGTNDVSKLGVLAYIYKWHLCVCQLSVIFSSLLTEQKDAMANKKLRSVCWKHSKSTQKSRVHDWLMAGSSPTGNKAFEQRLVRVSHLIGYSLEMDCISGNCVLFACLNFFGLQTISNLEESHWYFSSTSCINQVWFMFWAYLYVWSGFIESIQSSKFAFIPQLLSDRNMYNMESWNMVPHFHVSP